MAWVGRHLKDHPVPTSLPWAVTAPTEQLAGCCFSVSILNKDSQSSRKLAFIVAEFLCLFYEEEKIICPSTLRLFCLDCGQTHKSRILKMSQKSIVLKTILHQCIHVKRVMQAPNTFFCQATIYMLPFPFNFSEQNQIPSRSPMDVPCLAVLLLSFLLLVPLGLWHL